MTGNYKDLIDNFMRWGASYDRLGAALIVGSQARSDKKADEYSDCDIVMIVDDPNFFLSSDIWLNEIGVFYVSFVEDTLNGLKERRVLFDGALDIDFILYPADKIEHIFDSDAASILSNGYEMLIDKIGFVDRLKSLDMYKQDFTMPSERDFVNTVNDFWYHCVWTAKKIKRGELWTAKFCVDSYMKWKLISIIECHARIKHGIEYNTWYRGRFVEEWAQKWIIDELSSCFSHYNENDIKAALFSTMKLFRSLAVEIAGELNYPYPKKADEYTTEFVGVALKLDT